MKVVIADDEPLARERLRSLLAEQPDAEVVAEAGDGHEALHACAAHDPDVVLLDIAMPGMDGLEVLQALRKAWPALPVLMLSTYPERQYAVRAAQQGAPAGVDALSHRQHQVFRLLTAGQSVSEIGAQLKLAPNTVSTYRARILEKTGARNDVELALLARGAPAE